MIKGSYESDVRVVRDGCTGEVRRDRPQDPLGGPPLPRDVDLPHHLAQAAAVGNQPDPTATPSRTLLVRNVAANAADDKLTGIFKVGKTDRGGTQP